MGREWYRSWPPAEARTGRVPLPALPWKSDVNLGLVKGVSFLQGLRNLCQKA